MLELDGYRVEEALPGGTRFVLLRARRELDDTAVLIRTPSSAAPTRRDLVALQHEFDTTARLDLPAVPKPLELLDAAGRACLIMADPGGLPLRAWRPDGDPVLSICSVGARLAAVLSRVHASGLIHKEITPEHILIDTDTLAVHLTGFGIAANLARERGSGRATSHLEGTLAYMAPEQTGRMNRMVDQRSDLYALGVVLYEQLAGRLPFTATDPLELVHAHVAHEPAPLHEVDPTLPRAVSDVVARLLAKAAEARYQTAQGLARDLDEIVARLECGASLDDFTPGLHDASDKLLIPEKLYAREAEVGALLDAYARAVAGGSEVVLVSGYAGIGKSALIGEINRPITAGRGWFISGKFDQFRRGTPYAAVLQALRGLVGRLLTEPPEVLDAWRDRLQASLGPNGRVILDVIPELERIVGPQPPVPALGPSEARARFGRVFRAFIRVLAGREHPLVIFLDDLQWSDAATVELLELLLLDPDIGYVLFVGAFRDTELAAGDPLRSLMTRLQDGGASVRTIHVEGLPAVALVELLADTFRRPPEACADLAGVLLAKTGGNPFFVSEFLRALVDRGHVRFDLAEGGWVWDLEQIRALGVTANVVDLVTDRIRLLEPGCREVVELASCIGAEFDLATLDTVLARPAPVAAGLLQEALRLELIQPLDETYKYASLAGNGGSRETRTVRYRFIHDRVQQAANALIPEPRRQQLHGRIGRLLLEDAGEEELEERLFEIVDHLNSARELIDSDADRVRLAELNLRAGRRARVSMAYRSALDYLDAGLAALDDDRWTRHYDLVLGLCHERAEAAYLATDFDAMEAAAAPILAHARSVLDTVKVYELRIARYNSEIRYPEAVAAGLEILARLGEPLPDRPGTPRVLLGLAGTVQLLYGRGTDELLALPPMTDERQLAIMRVLMGIASATYYVNANLFPLLVFRLVRLSVRHGNAPLSAFGYACYGLILCGVVNRVDRGYSFGRLAIDLIERFGARELEAKIAHLTNLFILHWRDDLRDTFAPLLSGAQAGLETGDYEYSSYCRLFHGCHLLFSGQPLNTLEPVLRDHYDAVTAIHQDKTGGLFLLLFGVTQRLTGRDEVQAAVAGLPNDDVAPYLARWAEVQDRVSLSYAHFFEAMVATFLRRPDHVLEQVALLRPWEDNLKGQPFLPRLRVFESLALIERAPAGAAGRQARRRVASNLRQLRRWADWAPANYAHLYWLVEAERRRRWGRVGDALEAFERAIGHANDGRYTGDEALALERAARLHLALGNRQTALLYLRHAVVTYSTWGAGGMVARLEEEFPDARVAAAADGADVDLDLMGVVRSARALTEEVDLSRLLDRILALTLQTAGARRAFLVVPGTEDFIVAAGIDPEGTATLPERVSASRQLAQSVIHFAARSHDEVVVADAVRDPRFQDDPWIRGQRVRSLLCLPIRGRDQLLGLLYLENDLSPGVFTPQRLQILRILGAQAAISMENARLYESLAHEVEARTRELEVATGVAESERQKADRLLRNILPGAVADELKASGHVQPVRYDDTSVLFSDFVNFTGWAASVGPERLVADLNRIFLAFDEICARNHLEKIKTIGDAYMCAGGLPVRRRTHAVDACLAALEMRDLIEREHDAPGGVPWNIRLGIHSGPLLAGVIGRSRFAYDIWGDAVNVASRMEASGEPGRINVSSDTADLVRPFFTLMPRGRIRVRNRGDTDMYFVDAIRPELAEPGAPHLPGPAFREQYTKLLRGVSV